MSRQCQPVAVLKASGSRHYTKAELAEREAHEIKAPVPETITPPNYLPKALIEKFEHLATILLKIGIYSELDGDGLARYLIAEHNYLRITNKLSAALGAGNIDAASKLTAMQDRFFKQCRAAASDLGLTISSRCRLQAPFVFDEEPSEEAELFG